MVAPSTGQVRSRLAQLRRKDFLGMPLVDAPDLDGVVQALLERAWREEPSRSPVVTTPNVDIVVQLDSITNERVRQQFTNGWCVIPDGQPLVMLGNKCGVHFQARLAGSSLVESLWPELARTSQPALVIAANEATATALRAEHPQSSIYVAPIFDASDAESIRQIASDALASAGEQTPDFVFVAVGFPKSSLLISELVEQFDQSKPLPICLGVGASFEMYLGGRKRAPMWFQEHGLEWLYRFAQEPKRLFHRYFIRDSRFLLIAARTYSASKRGRR